MQIKYGKFEWSIDGKFVTLSYGETIKSAPLVDDPNDYWSCVGLPLTIQVETECEILFKQSRLVFKKLIQDSVCPLGYYKHNKSGKNYEAVGNTNDMMEVPYVVYKDNKRTFVRWQREFLQKFELISPFDSQLNLFVATLRLCRLDYQRYSADNPLFLSHGGNKTFKYVVGDKIAFARSVRIVDTKTANVLIGWVNKW